MLFNGLVSTISQVAKGVIGFIKGSDQPAVVYHDELLPMMPSVESLEEVAQIERWSDVNVSDAFADRLVLRISNFGNYKVKHVRSNTGEWVTSGSNLYIKHGSPYLPLQASVGKKPTYKNYNFAKLMMEKFGEIEPSYITECSLRSRLKCIKFKDGNVLNCHIENLRWITELELNALVAARSQKLSQAHAKRKKKAEGQVVLKAKLKEDTLSNSDLYWVPIPGYEGAYEISNFGTVRSLDRVIKNRAGRQQKFPGRDMKRVTAGGELAYGLSKNAEQTIFNAARLVVAVFKPDLVDTDREFRVIHIDGHNGNCHINNLKVEYI